MTSLPFSLATFLELLGSALVITGGWLIYRPLGLLVAGALCFAGSFVLEYQRVQVPLKAAADVDHQEEPELEREWAEAIPDHVKLTKGGLVRADT